MRLCFDLDGVFCTNTNGKYEEAIPYTEMIEFVNNLYDLGYFVIINTARGMGTCNHIPNKAATKWYSFTEKQLREWGLKYHELHLGKIMADVYIDDKAFRFNNVDELKSFLNDKNS